MKKKKNKMSTILAASLLVASIGLVGVSGTYAKYTSTITGTDTATIAKWDWTIGSGSDAKALSQLLTEGTTKGTYTFNLFKDVLDTKDGAAETDVNSITEGGVTKKMIAPGTKGTFSIELTNNSDVNATYSVTFKEKNPLGANIKYRVGGTGEYVTVTRTSADANGYYTINMPVSATLIGMVGTENDGNKATVIVDWKWDFEDGESADAIAAQDTADTLVGIAAATAADRTVEVQAEVTLVQVD